MSRLMLVGVLVTGAALGGCGKALTDASASGVIQKWINLQNAGTVSTSVEALTSQLGAERTSAWEAPDVQRLVKLGYLEEKTVSVSYPNFSGRYSGVHHEINMFGISVQTASHDTVDVRTVASTRPPHVEGQFTTCFEDGCDVASLGGEVRRNGPSVLTLTFPERGGGVLANRPGTRNRLVVRLERGQADAMVGHYTDSGSGLRGGIFIHADHVGPNPPDIQQGVYVYSWSKTLPKDAVSGSMLNLGHLVVDSCDRLLLSSETKATASCKTHVALTSAAAAVFGSRPTDRPMDASFGKQPDGTWVGTGIGYSAPTYGISEEPLSEGPTATSTIETGRAGANYSDIDEYLSALKRAVQRGDNVLIAELVEFPFDEQGSLLSRTDFIAKFRLSKELAASILSATSLRELPDNLGYGLNGEAGAVTIRRMQGGYWRWVSVFYGE